MLFLKGKDIVGGAWVSKKTLLDGHIYVEKKSKVKKKKVRLIKFSLLYRIKVMC